MTSKLDEEEGEKVTNYDVLIALPKSSFANMVFDAVRTKFKNLHEFEEFLDEEFSSEEGKKALQDLQRLTTD